MTAVLDGMKVGTSSKAAAPREDVGVVEFVLGLSDDDRKEDVEVADPRRGVGTMARGMTSGGRREEARRRERIVGGVAKGREGGCCRDEVDACEEADPLGERVMPRPSNSSSSSSSFSPAPALSRKTNGRSPRMDSGRRTMPTFSE